MRSKFTFPMTLMALAVGSITGASPAGAQITEVSRTPVAEIAQLTFGYRCDDRFVIRNDGAKPVDVEYALEKGTEHVKLTLGARELVELDSKSKAAMELWMDGKLVAKAIKEKRACKDVLGNASVAIAPLEVETNERDDRSYNNARYPLYDPFMFAGFGYYGSYGFSPFYRGFRGIPIIIGGVRTGRPRGR
ncbi:MAG: hypothetical protein IPP90_23370 [Gemmatimonadaceae bacterium]|nr:hypothetical protein [Gemmatimonadaceae bacterium]